MALPQCAAGARTGRGTTLTPSAYASDATALAVAPGRGDASAAQVHDRCREHGLKIDGRLADLAASLASHGAPDAALIRAEARARGLFEPVPVVWQAQAGALPALHAALTDVLAESALQIPLTHCGAAVRRDTAGVTLSVVLSGRFLELAAPVPARVAEGATVRIRGTLTHGYHSPKVVHTSPDGSTEQADLPRGRGMDFRLRLGEPGKYSIEVLGDGPRGIQVLSIMDVVSGDAPRRPTREAPTRPAETTAAAVRARLLQLVAKERRRHERRALSEDEELAQVALAHSEDMVRHGFVAHVSPTHGQPLDRTLNAGIHTTTLLENIGRGYSAQEIHEGLMDSPGHRENLLNPDVQSVGIGVVAEREGSGQAFVATQLFALRAHPFAEPDARSSLQRARAQRRLPKVAVNPALTQLAQEAADGYARLPADAARAQSNELVANATKSARLSPAEGSLRATLVLATDPKHIARAEASLDPRTRAVGIGVAALPARLGHRHPAVIVLLSTSR